MQTWNTANYVTKKFAVRECPIVLAHLLNTSRVRFALLQTNCYLDVQSRVLNWRHRATPWTKGAIVEVAGPNYSSIDHCNDLIESLVPFYATRRPYVEITPYRMRRYFRKRSADETKEKCRASSSTPAPDIRGSGESVLQENIIKYSTFLPDPSADAPKCDRNSTEIESCQISSKSPIIGPRLPRSRALSCHIQSTEEYIDRSTLQKEEKLAVDYSALQKSDVKNSTLERAGDELQMTLEQNKHNATGNVEVAPNLRTDLFTLRVLKPISVGRSSTFPRPKLFESERSVRLAIHSQKAAAVRASLQKMKEDKYRRFPSAVAHKSPRQKTSMSVNRLMKSRSVRATTPKALGDHVGRLPIYCASGIDEKILNSPSPELRDVHITRSWDRLSGTAKPQHLIHISQLALIPFAETPKGSPHIRNLLSRTRAEISEDQLAQNTLITNSETNTTEIPTTGASQPNIETDSGVWTTKKKSLTSTGIDPTKVLVPRSDVPECRHVPFPPPETVVGGVLNGHPCTDPPSHSQNLSGPCPVLTRLSLHTVSSSCSSQVLSATPIFVNEPEYKLHMPNYPGELDGTDCRPLNVAHSAGKTLTDVAEYRRTTHHKAQKSFTQPDLSLSSEFSNLEPRLCSHHIPASDVARPHTIYEPQSLPNETTEMAPNQLLSPTPVSPSYRQSSNIIGTKVKLGDSNSVKPTVHPLLSSFSTNPKVRLRLFEQIDFCSRETTDTQDVMESEVYVRPLEIDLGQLPRRTEIRMEEPSTGDVVEDDILMIPNTDIELSNNILSSVPICGSADQISRSMKQSIRKTEQNARNDNIVNSITGAGKFTECQQKHATSIPNQQSNLEDRQISKQNKTISRITNAENSGHQFGGNSLLHVSSKHSPRISREIETVPLKEPVNRFPSKGKPKISERITMDCIRKEIPQKRPISKSVISGRTNGSCPTSRVTVGKSTTLLRAGSVGKTNGPKPRQTFKAKPQFPSGTRLARDLNAPEPRVSQNAGKATDSCVGDSAAVIPSSLSRPNVTTPWPSKGRESTNRVINDQQTVHSTLGSSSLTGPVEAPQAGLVLGAGISSDRIPSAASTGMFAGYSSPGSSHGYESAESHPRHRSQMTSQTEHTTTVETSESSTVTTSDDSSDSSTVLGSNDETPYAFPESIGGFATTESTKFTRETGRLQSISAFNMKKRALTQYDSHELYRARNTGKRKPRRSFSAECRDEHKSHVISKRRFRSSSVYHKILRCLPLQWCFGK